MKASWEKIEKNQGVLQIEVETERVAEALDKAFKKVVSKVNVPGFRKGKVPRPIFEARFGVESLYQDALDILLPQAYTDAVKETGIEPVDRPEVDVEQFSKGTPLVFKATVQVKPEVKLGEYKDLEVEEKSTEVTVEEIDEELKRLQQRHAELVTIEDRAAETGDTVTIDFEGFTDGMPFEGGKAEKYSLELGSNSFIPGFEEQVVGMQKDGEKDIEVTFPEDYHAEELKGKPAVFKVKLRDIKHKNLPELDDEFAKDVSEFDTLEEYRQDIGKRLKEQKEQENRQSKEAAVVEKAAAGAEIDIPEVMIDSEVDFMLRDFANRLRMQGMTLEMYYQISGQNEEALKQQMREDAEKRVRNNLTLEAIAKAEKITVNEEEVSKELENMAASYQRTAEELRNILQTNGTLENLDKDIQIKKTIDFLLEHSKTVSAEA